MCCRQPNYRFHERKINKKIAPLKASEFMTNCEGVWKSLLLLVANLIKINERILLLSFEGYALAIGP